MIGLFRRSALYFRQILHIDTAHLILLHRVRQSLSTLLLMSRKLALM